VTNAGNVAGQIEGIRQQTVAILDELIARADQFDLADPPPVLNHYRDKLRENSYKVLVVGEAKRGKSTFVNALIGRDILPTDVDVATSQVFNIRPSEREAYRVRYEDGSEREILPEDLPLYGSQTAPGAGYLPAPDPTDPGPNTESNPPVSDPTNPGPIEIDPRWIFNRPWPDPGEPGPDEPGPDEPGPDVQQDPYWPDPDDDFIPPH